MTDSADRERRLTYWNLAVAAVLLLAMAAPSIFGRVYVRDDLGAFHLPARAFYAEQLSRGEPFDWMPSLFSGFFLTGEGQAGTYHPLHWLLYRILPLTTAFDCECLASYPFLFAGMWLWLKRLLGRGDAAAFGSLTFTFGSFNLLHFIHPNAVAIVAHLPWLLWALDITLVESRRVQVALGQAAIALLTGSQILLGYPQYVWFSLLTETAYVAFVLHQRGRAPREGCEQLASCRQCVGCTGASWAKPAIGVAVGVLLGGVQLLPTLEALSLSARRAADASFTGWGSMSPRNLVQLIAPYFYPHRVFGENTHELGLYVGAVPLVLAVYALSRVRSLGRLTLLAYAASGFAALTLLLALGQHGPLYPLLSCLPGLSSFRFPCRYIVLTQLSIAVLAATGFMLLCQARAPSHDRLRASDNSRAWPVLRTAQGDDCWLWFLFAASVSLAAVGWFRPSDVSVASWQLLAGPLLIGGAVFSTVAAARGRIWAMPLMIVLTAADLGCYGLSCSIFPTPFTLESFIAASDTPPGDSHARAVADLLRFDDPGLRTGNALILAGWQRADGYAGLEPQRNLDFHEPEALRVAGVRWIRQAPNSEAIPSVAPGKPRWLESLRPLPRVRLVNHTQRSVNPADDLSKIDIESAALCEADLSLPPGKPGMASLVDDSPGHIEIAVEAPASRMLVVAESFHPGWHATADGRSREILRVNGDFMGCLIEPGDRQVRFDFRPRTVQVGWCDSLLGLALVGCCLLTALPRRNAVTA